MLTQITAKALTLAAEDHGHTDGGFFEEAIHILTDPAHWIAELAAELIFLLLIHYWLMDKIAHRHERKHGKTKETETHNA